MADNQNEEGPKLVWTFPLITRIQSGSRFLDIGGNLGSIMSSDGVGSRVRDRMESATQQSDEDSTDGIEDEIDDLQESGESIFSSDTDYGSGHDVTEVTIQGDVFIPTRASVPEGGTVRWVNEDDKSHKVSAIEGDDFTSSTLQPGDTYEQTFQEEGVVIYIDSTRGAEQMSGAIVVGSAIAPDTLPSESETDPELFNEDIEMRTMSQAAKDKEDMDKGF